MCRHTAGPVLGVCVCLAMGVDDVEQSVGAKLMLWVVQVPAKNERKTDR